MKRVPIRETRFGRIFENAELATGYARRHAASARQAGERFARFLRQTHRVPTRILDVGSGSGDTLMALADHFPRAEPVGVDLCRPLLAIARRKASQSGHEGRIRFLDAGATALPLANARFGWLEGIDEATARRRGRREWET